MDIGIIKVFSTIYTYLIVLVPINCKIYTKLFYLLKWNKFDKLKLCINLFSMITWLLMQVGISFRDFISWGISFEYHDVFTRGLWRWSWYWGYLGWFPLNGKLETDLLQEIAYHWIFIDKMFYFDHELVKTSSCSKT